MTPQEIHEMFVETVFDHRWTLLVGYHEIGRVILENNLSIEEVASACSQRPKTVHYCVELYKAYPDLNSLPEGKNISFYQVCKLLPPYEESTTKKEKRAKKEK